jgi:hypothetical protein
MVHIQLPSSGLKCEVSAELYKQDTSRYSKWKVGRDKMEPVLGCIDYDIM